MVTRAHKTRSFLWSILGSVLALLQNRLSCIFWLCRNLETTWRNFPFWRIRKENFLIKSIIFRRSLCAFDSRGEYMTTESRSSEKVQKLRWLREGDKLVINHSLVADPKWMFYHLILFLCSLCVFLHQLNIKYRLVQLC